MSVILNPIEQFFDLDGSPLQNGYIYLGDVSANPETNPVQVYWDAAFTIPAAQPIRTVNGFPVRSLNSGTPATIYTVNVVSMQVRNSKKLSVFYAPTSSQSSTSQNTLIRTSNTILTASDNARTVLASGTFSQTFDASVSLQNGWFVRYVNVGNGIITFDPNLSELIDGFTTEKLFAGQECTIYCNGIGLTTAGLAIDTDIVFTGNLDATKTFNFDADALITTANRRVLTVQDKNYTLAGLDDIAAIVFPPRVSVRQTVMNASVDTSGLPNFMSGVGTSTLTIAGSASVPFVCLAANGSDSGGDIDRTGFSTSNLTLAGMNTNGTFTIYATISIAGVITLSAQNQATLTPVYQAGGTPAVTSGLFTFNYQQMQGFLGNGTTAPQAYMVAIGEVTVAANVISTLTPYGLMGRFTSVTSTLPAAGTALSFNHNIGLSIENLEVSCKLRATAADAICAAGEIIDLSNLFFVGALGRGIGSYSSSKNNWTLRASSAYEAIGSIGASSIINTNYTALVTIHRKW